MHMNSGYVGWSMSRRAARAYDDGLAPLSQIGRSPYVRAAARALGPAEWHHTSKLCNRTDFYDARAVLAIAAQLRAAGDKTGSIIEAKRDARRLPARVRARDNASDRVARYKWLIQTANEYAAAASDQWLRAEAAAAQEPRDPCWRVGQLLDNAARNMAVAERYRSEARALVAEARRATNQGD